MQEDVNHDEHENQGEHQGEYHLLNRCIQELSNVVVDLIHHARWERLSLFLQFLLYVLSNLVGVRTSNLLHHTQHRRDVVVFHRHGVLLTAQLYLGDILQFQRLTLSVALDDDVAELLGSLQTTGIAHGILVSHVRLFTESTWGCLNILFSQHASNIARHQVVLLHHVRFQPDTHRVSLQTRRHHITHTLNTLDGWNDIDIGVVRQELVVIATIGGQRVHDDLRRLSLRYRDTDLVYLGRQQGTGLRHTVLYVYGTHIGVGTLAEQHADLCRTRRGCRRDIVHALHTIDALFQRRDDRVLNGLCISTWVAGPDGHRRRCNIGILLNRQRHQSNETQQDDEDRNHRRQYRAFNKSCKSHNCNYQLSFFNYFFIALTISPALMALACSAIFCS